MSVVEGEIQVGIKSLKPAVIALFMLLFAAPIVYAYPVWDYDRDDGTTGSWCDAYVAGQFNGTMFLNIVHRLRSHLEPDCTGNTWYIQVPSTEGQDWYYGDALIRLVVYKNGILVEILEAYASIG